MATYKEIKGVTVQTLDSDPVVKAAVWSSGGNLNTARNTKGSSAGTQTQSSVLVVRLHLDFLMLMNNTMGLHGQKQLK